MDKLVEIVAFLWKRIYFPDGLIVLIIFAEILYYGAAKAVGRHVVLSLNSLGCTSALEICRVIYLSGFIFIPLFAWLIWTWIRGMPRCNKKELGIFFAPNANADTQEEMNRLFIHLKQEIKLRELGVNFNIKRLKPNLTIDSPEEATSILRRANAVVAVWGAVEHQTTEQGKTTGFSSLSVTFVHRSTTIDPRRHVAMALAFAGRQFQVRERTQIADQHIVAKDISIIVRNTLGVALLIDNRFSEASKVLGSLYVDLKSLFPSKTPGAVKRFCLQVQYDFAFALSAAISEEYNGWLLKSNLYQIPESTLKQWLERVNQAISLDPQNSAHNISKAIYYFLLGNIPAAIQAEKKADKLAPSAVAIANLGLAFLYNFNGNYQLSRRQYRLGLAKKTSNDELAISQCITFIAQTIKQFPEKKQLYLALGVLEHHRGSIAKARKAFQSLIDDPPEDPKLQPFVEEARSYLGKKEFQV